MAWITSHQALRDHPKVVDLMQGMGWDLDTTLGKLHRFWWWCVDYAENGDLRKHNDDRLGAAVGVLPGEDSKRFVAAMVAARWLDRKPYFRVHDWWDYFGMFLQRKYSDQRERWEAVKVLYSPKTVHRQLLSHISTNLPTNLNLPTNQNIKDGAASPPSSVDNLCKTPPDRPSEDHLLSTMMSHVQQALKTKTGAVRTAQAKAIYGRVIAWVKDHPGRLYGFLTDFDKTPPDMAPAWYVSWATGFVNREAHQEVKRLAEGVGQLA